MFRAAPRLIARSPALYRGVAPARRCISTAPPAQKSRSWKSLAARFGIAGTIIYYYNTTDVFAEEPHHPTQSLSPTEAESEPLPTIESLTAEREKRKAVQAQLDEQAQKQALSTQRNAPQQGEGDGMGGLEQEADQQGAFNPETGEINWDCPCLGGMADGPCGPQFKEAFSCFVFSEEEPKGMDCIDRFKNMQNCFREHPDVYGSELESDAADDDEDEELHARAAPEHATPNHEQSESIPTSAYADASTAPPPKPSKSAQHKTSQDKPISESTPAASSQGKQSFERTSQPARPNLGLVPEEYKPEKGKKEEPASESERLVPKGAHDAGEEGTERLGRK